MIDLYEAKGTQHITGSLKLLRKTYVTNLIANGAAIEDTSFSAGHSDTEVTRKHYTAKDFQIFKEKYIKTFKKLKDFRNDLKYEIFENK